MYLKFNELDTIYEIDESKIFFKNNTLITITDSTIPSCENGFIIFSNIENIDDSILYNCNNYNVIFNKTEDEITFSCNNSIKYIYYILDDNNYIINYEIKLAPVEIEKMILVRAGIGINYEYVDLLEIYDSYENHIPKFRYKDNQICEVSEEDIQEWLSIQLEEIRQQKLDMISQECKTAIVNGIEHNGEYFSYTTDDQNNILNLNQLSKATGLSVPYHANGLGCKLYTPEEIGAIYVKQEMNVTHHTTYHNQLKFYINSLQTIEELNSIYYGMELTGQYLDTYNEIMQSANLIVSVVTAN